MLTHAYESLRQRYDSATPEQIRRGREWYAEARRECRMIAEESGFDFRRVAAVLAVTSPDSQLVHNLKATRKACLNGGTTAGRYPKDQLPKVKAALYGPSPDTAPRGPKVEQFYRAVVGETDALVIDRWASYAAGGPKDRVPRIAERRVIEQAYRDLSEATGENLRDLQAILWLQCRESTPDVRGTVKKYADLDGQLRLALQV